MVLLAASGPAWSQQAPPFDARRGLATRQELTDLLSLHEKTAESPAYSEALRARSRLDASRIRERLERGDFQVGDGIVLAVAREDTLTSTYVVTEGPTLRLPVVRDVSLAGVLRSELEGHVRTQLARFIDDPQVHAQSVIRIWIWGAVGRPGFYPAPSASLLSEALMLAGGPSPNARVDGITIERDGRRIWLGDQVRQAIVEGHTLDQLDVRAGDRIRVPQRGGRLGGAEGVIRWVTVLTTLPISIFTVTRLF